MCYLLPRGGRDRRPAIYIDVKLQHQLVDFVQRQDAVAVKVGAQEESFGVIREPLSDRPLGASSSQKPLVSLCLSAPSRRRPEVVPGREQRDSSAAQNQGGRERFAGYTHCTFGWALENELGMCMGQSMTTKLNNGPMFAWLGPFPTPC